MLKADGITHEGLKRDHNEDSILVNKRVGLFAVADGMGGHACGEVASRMAVQILHRHMESELSGVRNRVPLGADGLGNMLLEGVEAANSHIYEFSRNLARKNPGDSVVMGTTLSAVLILKEMFFIVHVGDSRIYRFRANTLEKLTKDHSEAQELIDAGILHEEEAEEHPSSHVLTRAVGVSTRVNPDRLSCKVEEGDQFLLASDGLFRVLDEKMVLDTLCRRATLREKSGRLLARTLEGGAPDNVSVVLVDSTKRSCFRRIFWPTNSSLLV